MKFACIGGGPAGLYLAILLKRWDAEHEVVVHERNRLDDPFGFGVVFSDATSDNLAAAEPTTYAEMSNRFYHWDDIEIFYNDEVLRSTGHGFSGMSRRAMMEVLARRCEQLGVELHFSDEVDDLSKFAGADLIVAADGANSALRGRYAETFRPTVDWRPNRFVWLGTSRTFPAFTFYFKADRHGLWRVHAYQYEGDERGGQSTFIVETTEETFCRSGLDPDDEDATIEFCERLFAEELDGHPLLKNRSLWRNFPTVRNESWSYLPGDGESEPPAPLALIGDAAHTAHFSIGSGTKLAMEDAIALVAALREHDCIPSALAAYEEERRPVVESTQRAAQVSLQWFEETERFMDTEPIQFAFNLLTRSLRVTHDNLKVRDPDFVERVDRWFAEQVAAQSGERVSTSPLPPPLFTPYRVRGLLLKNRVVVSPMCQYSAEDGVPNDWHLVHLGSRAIGGAGLIIAEMTNINPEARISPGCTGLYSPEHVTAWRRITDFVHEHSETSIGVQLGHAGRKGSTRLSWEGDCRPLSDEQCWEIFAASPIPYYPESPVPKAVERSDMDRLVEDYVRSTELALEAGFDWLELHCAHGYLLASFISPLTNLREDEYGGSLESRLRFPLEVFDAVRAAWPEHMPISVRISAVDWKEGGVDSDEAVEIARAFKEHGVDIIDVSAGQTVPDQKPVYGRQFQTPFSDRIRQEVEVPTMAVGNISSFTDVNTILAAGRADLVLMARAHLWDPYWTRHAAYEMNYPLPWPNQYSTLKRYTPRLTAEGTAF